ncbi:MAG: TlpA family protein disulfide reductase [Nitrospinae bacterium]|nr:TlpA family protein disulfide reductase [Nitrospinota bacterium]
MSDEQAGGETFLLGRRNQIILLLALALILNILFNYVVSNDASINETLKVGDPFPPFEASGRGGVSLTGSSFAGKPLLYFFFANWCPCSHESIGWVKRAEEEYRDRGLSVVGVGIQDQPERLEQFVRLHTLAFPVITSEAGEDIAKSAGVQVTPTTIFVDGGGIVRFIHVGKIETWGQMTGGLDTIFGAPSAGEGA